MALTARCWAPARLSPSAPGKRTALGWAWTTDHSGSFASVSSFSPVQSPYRTSPNRSSTWVGTPLRPCKITSAVSRQRSSGLATTAVSGRSRSRAASAVTWARPRSSRCTPGVQPASTGPVNAVNPWRTSRTIVISRTLCAAGLEPGVGDVVERVADLLRQGDVVGLQDAAQLRGGPGADDRRHDPRSVTYPTERHGQRRDAQTVAGGGHRLDDLPAPVAEVGPDELGEVRRRGARVGGDARSVLAGQHAAAERRPGQQADARVQRGRHHLTFDVAAQQ